MATSSLSELSESPAFSSASRVSEFSESHDAQSPTTTTNPTSKRVVAASVVASKRKLQSKRFGTSRFLTPKEDTEVREDMMEYVQIVERYESTIVENATNFAARRRETFESYDRAVPARRHRI